MATPQELLQKKTSQTLEQVKAAKASGLSQEELRAQFGGNVAKIKEAQQVVQPTQAPAPVPVQAPPEQAAAPSQAPQPTAIGEPVSVIRDQVPAPTSDNITTNNLVDQGKLPEWQRENVPQKGQYTTAEGVDPNAFTGQMMFEQQVKDMGAPQAQEFMDKRNDRLASNLVGKLNTAIKTGNMVDDSSRDQLLMQAISEQGGTVDWNDPDRQNTIDNIYDKIIKEKGFENWEDFYKRSNIVAEKAKSYNNMPTEKAVEDYTTGNMSEEVLDSISQTNPAKHAEITAGIEESNTLFTMNNTLNTYDQMFNEDKGSEFKTAGYMDNVIDKLNMFSSNVDINAGAAVVDAYRKELNNPDLLKLQDELSNQDAEVEDIDLQIQNIVKEVKAAYPNIPKNDLNNIIADRTSDLIDKKNSIMLDSRNLSNKINTRLDMAKAESELMAKELEINANMRAEQFGYFDYGYQVLNAETQRLDKYNRAEFNDELNRNNYTRKAGFDRTFTEGDIDSKDPKDVKRAVTNAVEDTLAEFAGIPMVRSKEQMVEDIQAGLANGTYKSLGEGITKNIREPIQGKPEYQAYIDSTFFPNKNKTPEITKIGDQGYYWKDGKLVSIGAGGYEATKTYSEASTRSERITGMKSIVSEYADMGLEGGALAVSQIEDGAYGGRCGQFVNDYGDAIGDTSGIHFGDTLASKTKRTEDSVTGSDVPVVGGYVVMSSGGEYSANGHVGIVTSVSADGKTFTMKSSSKGGDKKVRTDRDIPVDGKSIKGFAVPTFNAKVAKEGNNSIDAGEYSSNFDRARMNIYTQFMEGTKTPTEKQIEQLGGYDKFTKDASKAYLETQNRILESRGMEMTDPEFYLSMSKEDRKTFDSDTKNIASISSKIDSIINDVKGEDLPRQSMVGEGRALQAKVRDLQLALKGEGAYNLGVLSGPDLDLLESIIPSVGWKSKAGGTEGFIKMLETARNTFTSEMNKNNAGYGVKLKVPTNTIDNTEFQNKKTEVYDSMIGVVSGQSTPTSVYDIQVY